MSLTAAYIEEVIHSRLGGFIAQAREITEDPNQPSILAAASWALRKLGETPASVLTVSDAEAGMVSVGYVDVFLDLTELQVLRSIQGNFPAVDITTGPQSVKASGLNSAIQAMIQRRTAEIQAEHGSRIPGVLTPGKRKARILYP